MNKDSHYWIEKLKLIAHPEGGYYAETYKSDAYLSSACKKTRSLKRKLQE
jgi:predicted cupin superfamily sugar epimerase